MKPRFNLLRASCRFLTFCGAATLTTSALSTVPAKAANADYSQVVLNSQPIAYYRLNDSSYTLVDSTSNRLHGKYGPGVLHGAPILTSTDDDSTFYKGGAYNPNNLAFVLPTGKLEPTSAVTVEAWVSEAAANTSNQFIPFAAYGRQAAGPAYSLSISPQNSVNFWLKTTRGGVSVNGSTILQPGHPYQVACTYDGMSARIYVDGQVDGSANVRGAIEYSGIGASDGLAIGGALNGNRQIFGGSVSEVSLYRRSLSAPEIQQHYVFGAAPQVYNEVASTADSFVDMLGLNVHLHYTNSPYARNYPGIKSLLLGLGARHIRDALADTTWQPYYDRLNDLGSAGIKATLTTDRAQTASELRAIPKHVTRSLEAFEGPNEQDIMYRSDSQWSQKARAFQKLLYTTTHGNSATRNVPVLGPTLSGPSADQAVGDLSAYVDRGNYHEYWGGRNPGTIGWGSHSVYGWYGSMDWNLNIARIVAGSKPLQNTETGYNTGAGAGGNVPLDIQEKYVPRILLETFLRNVERAFVFELIDNTTTPSTANSFQYGLATANLRPKPAYMALANLNALLVDRGASFTPSALRYNMAGNMANVHHLLLQKRDGSYYLVMWIEAAGWQPANSRSGGGSYIRIAPQKVYLSLPRAARALTFTTWHADGGTATTGLPAGATTALSLTDNISVLHIMP